MERQLPDLFGDRAHNGSKEFAGTLFAKLLLIFVISTTNCLAQASAQAVDINQDASKFPIGTSQLEIAAGKTWFTVNNETDRHVLWSGTAEGAERELTDGKPFTRTRLHFSDGSTLVFSAKVVGQSNRTIWIANADGFKQLSIANTDATSSPTLKSVLAAGPSDTGVVVIAEFHASDSEPGHVAIFNFSENVDGIFEVSTPIATFTGDDRFSLKLGHSNGRLFFKLASITSLGSHEIWVTDGTETGTFKLFGDTADQMGDADWFLPTKHHLFVQFRRARHCEVWTIKTDGPENTLRFIGDSDFVPASDDSKNCPAEMVLLGRNIFVYKAIEGVTSKLRRYNVASSRRAELASFTGAHNISSLQSRERDVWFIADNEPGKPVIWQKDAPSNGQLRTRPIPPSSHTLQSLTVMPAGVFAVSRRSGAPSHHIYFYVPESEERHVTRAFRGAVRSIVRFDQDKTAFFANDAEAGVQLFVADLDARTVTGVSDFDAPTLGSFDDQLNYSPILDVGGDAVFCALTGDTPGLFESDGTAANTDSLNINFGPGDRQDCGSYVTEDGQIYFLRNTETGTDVEIWRTRTNADPVRVAKSQAASGTRPDELTVIGDRLVLSTVIQPPRPALPYRTLAVVTLYDETSGKWETLDKRIRSPKLVGKSGSVLWYSSWTTITDDNDTVRRGYRIWKTDGTDDNTTSIDIGELFSRVDAVTWHDRKLYVAGRYGNEHGLFALTPRNARNEFSSELVQRLSTTQLKRISQLVSFQDNVYFTVNTALSPEIWSTDGTSAGTGKIVSADDGFAELGDPMVFGNRLWFGGYRRGASADEPGPSEWELLSTDGTAIGVQVEHVQAHSDRGENTQAPERLFPVGNSLSFFASSDGLGKELWFFKPADATTGDGDDGETDEGTETGTDTSDGGETDEGTEGGTDTSNGGETDAGTEGGNDTSDGDSPGESDSGPGAPSGTSDSGTVTTLGVQTTR